MRATELYDPAHRGLLDSPAWPRCEGLIRAFEEARRRGESPRLEEYLRADGPERKALLIELVHVDLELRLKSGESARVEAYLGAYPELACDHRATVGLLAAEYQQRRLSKGGVALEEYRKRFPNYWEDLFRLVGTADTHTLDRASGTALKALGRFAIPGYEIIAEIGRGGMGIVYKALEPNLGRYVALKFLPGDYVRDSDRLERFLREARTASALNHPHICTVHALGAHEGRPFIVMEFIEGRTLRVLATRRPSVDESARLIAQAARALAAAHAAGVVHRDIKPENIMVRADGYVKVLDFGLARRLPTLAQPDPQRGPDTDPGALLGTAAYMSPEQTQGKAVQSASDIFSLGIVLYELLTGKHPFAADSPLAMLQAIATAQPVSPTRLNPAVPLALVGLIEAMLHKDARLRPTAMEVEAALGATRGNAATPVAPAQPSRPIVRREPELAALRAALADADAGRGMLVCIAGEPGIGKTTLVEDFMSELASAGPGCLIARGHCSERLGSSEAYLPVLDALADLLRSEGSGAVARLMKVVAPTWHTQIIPATRAGGSLDEMAGVQASSQTALLREFCSLLQETTRLGTLILFLDDIHWADVSTVDLLAHVSRHWHGLRVLVVVTYRPTELLLGPHPFHAVKLELQGRGACTDLALKFLARQEVDGFLQLAFPGHAFPDDLAELVHARTEGSPLFMVDLLRYLRVRGVIAHTGGRWRLASDLPDLHRELPESIRSMIQRKLERLSEDDRRLLAAASVQGHEFDSAAVASVVKRDAADVEERLQMLERVHGLVRLIRSHEFPDRTLSVRCAFVHILYQQALYAELTPSRRAALSLALAETLERHHREQSPGIAAELGYLYEVGRDFSKAARQFCLAARSAARVFAHREAVVLARHGLDLVESLPEGPERLAMELPLQTTLGLQLQVTEGYAAPGAERAYSRARELCFRDPGKSSLFPVLWGLWLFHKVRSELPRAQGIAEELQAEALALNDPNLALQAHQALGLTALCRGRLSAAAEHVEQAAALYDPRRHHAHASLFGQDPGVICKAYGAVALWLLGFPDAARVQSELAMHMSSELSPISRVVAFHFAAVQYQLRRDWEKTQECADASRALSAEHGFSFWLAGARVLGGWALAKQGHAVEGIETIRQGLRDWRAICSVTYETHYLGLLAEVLIEHGQLEEGQRILEDALALVQQTDERFYEPELHRLRGLAAAGKRDFARAEADFRRALELARGQRAKSLELRAAMNLVRTDPQLLAELRAWFGDGEITQDLKDADELLRAASRRVCTAESPADCR